MYTKVYKGEEARKFVLEGAEELFETAAESYGPDSGNVGILRDLSGLDVTHDGVTIVRSIELKGPKRAGAEVIKKTAIKMDKEQGDGTTTVVILAYSIIKAVQDRIQLGESPIVVRRSLQEEAKLAYKELEGMAIGNVTEDMLEQVAAISAGDELLGAKIAKVVYEVGLEGRVTVESGLSTTVEADLTKGYVIGNGIASNYMIADPATLTTTLEKPEILVADKKVDDLQVIADVIKGVNNKPLLIIANDFSDSVISSIVKWNQQGITNIVFVKSPRFAEKRTEMLKDIAAFIGTEIGGEAIKLGHADKVVVGIDETTIFSGHGDVTERTEVIKKQLGLEVDAFEKRELENRLAALTGKAAVIKVGAQSEDELNELKYRVDDAVFACRAALRSGVVLGGAVTPFDVARALPEGTVLRQVLQEPIKILLNNAGLKLEDFEVGEGMGVNVQTGELVDLLKAGIIEPADTIKKAIEYAVSIAGTAITMRRLVVEEEDEDE